VEKAEEENSGSQEDGEEEEEEEVYPAAITEYISADPEHSCQVASVNSALTLS
jgi:hypothetical protein